MATFALCRVLTQTCESWTHQNSLKFVLLKAKHIKRNETVIILIPLGNN